MMKNAGMRALAVSFPETVRTNDFYRTRYPEAVEAAGKRALGRLWRPAEELDLFSQEMLPYAEDPFRGTVERRVLADGETALMLEARAARKALAAARMSPSDIDLMIVTSFLPDQLGVGNAAFLARELGVRCPAFNLETACASSVVAFQVAAGLVRAGQHKNVLVVASCTYSRTADDANPVTWFLGDGAGAFIVGEVGEGEGLLGHASIATTETCGTFYFEPAPGTPRSMLMTCSPDTGRILHETAEAHLKECCQGALARAKARIEEVDLLVCNTPTAWFSAFAARALGLPKDKTVNTYPRYANVGAALMPANLHAAALGDRIRPGALVLLYAVGSVSSASAALMRWGRVAVAE